MCKMIGKLATSLLVLALPIFILTQCSLFDNSSSNKTAVVVNSNSAITGFVILGVQGVITGSEIVVPVPAGTDLTNLTPTIQITGKSVSPASGVPQNFTGNVNYTVTASSGATSTYTVIVVEQYCFTACPPARQKSLVLSWDANREKGVNSASGGYTINVACSSTNQNTDVPYVTGTAAPVTNTMTLCPGYYSVKVQGYSSLNPANGEWSAAKTVTIK